MKIRCKMSHYKAQRAKVETMKKKKKKKFGTADEKLAKLLVIPQAENTERENLDFHTRLLMEVLDHPLASYWQTKITHQPYTLTPVAQNTEEYNKILNLFKTSAGSLKLEKLERIENPYLLARYLLKKEKIVRQNHFVQERDLFHGTKRRNIENICESNFNWRRCGSSSGHTYGRGVYFTPQALTASNYTPSDENVMFLVKVLISKITLGNNSTVVPKSSSDTTTDHCRNTFVKYEDGDFYPQYVIHFSRDLDGDRTAQVFHNNNNFGMFISYNTFMNGNYSFLFNK